MNFPTNNFMSPFNIPPINPNYFIMNNPQNMYIPYMHPPYLPINTIQPLNQNLSIKNNGFMNYIPPFPPIRPSPLTNFSTPNNNTFPLNIAKRSYEMFDDQKINCVISEEKTLRYNSFKNISGFKRVTKKPEEKKTESSIKNQMIMKTQTFSFDSNENDFEMNKEVNNALINLILKLISKREVEEKEFMKLNTLCFQILAIFMYKRDLISKDVAVDLGNIEEKDWKKFKILKKTFRKYSNSNESGLKETIVNRVLRLCFKDWLKKSEIEENVLSNNYLINKNFWKDFFANKEESEFEKIFLCIQNSLQIQKKKLKMNTVVNSKKKPKFLNLVFRKDLLLKILNHSKNSDTFNSNFKLYKETIMNKYNDNDENEQNIELGSYHNKDELKFNLNLKHQFKKLIQESIKRLNLPKSPFGIKFDLKKKMRDVIFPITLCDYEKVFEFLEKCIEKESITD